MDHSELENLPCSADKKLSECSLVAVNNNKNDPRKASGNPSEDYGLEDCLKRKANTASDEEVEHQPEIKKQKWNKLWEPVEIPPNLSKRQRKKYIRKVLWETKWKPLRRHAILTSK